MSIISQINDGHETREISLLVVAYERLLDIMSPSFSPPATMILY